MPEDSLLEDDELSEGRPVVEEDKQTLKEEEDDSSTSHVESDTSKTQSPSSDKGATSSQLEEEKIRIIIEEEKMEDNEDGEEEKERSSVDKLEVKSGATNSVNSNLPPAADSPRRDQVCFSTTV